MGGFGFGFGARMQGAARHVSAGKGNPVPLLSPSLQWNGKAGSGFSSIPVDPARISAKPAIRPIVPPNQFFTNELLIGVLAAANNSGSLRENLGIKKVIAHCEGMSREILTPTFQTFADANGTYRTYFGWWTLLRNDGRSGHLRVYFEAIPTDEAMQSRVVGPYQFSPQQSMHDTSVTVAAHGAADFPSVAEALAHCRAQTFQNPLVTITEAGDYDIANSMLAYEGEGYCTIAASVPGVRIAKPAYANDAAAAIRSGYSGLRFRGANLTLDMQHILEIHTEPGATRQHWMDGCNIVNSAGQGALWHGVDRPAASIVKDGGWFTECNVENCSDPFRHASLVRGTSESNGVGALYSDCSAVIGNVSSGHRSDTTLAKDVPALDVRYTGTAATATIELAGSNAASTRTVTVKIAGDAALTFALQKSEVAYQVGTNYTLKNLADWLNSIPGLVATLCDITSGRAAAWLSLPGLSGAEFGPRDIKASALALVTFVDTSTDWWKAGATCENVVLWGNTATNVVAPSFDLGAATPKLDMLIANNAIQNDRNALASAANSTQFDGANSHIVFVHNTLSTQRATFRTDLAYVAAGYNLFANNSVRGIAWSGVAASTPVVDNHIQAGEALPASAPGQSNVSGTTMGGDDSTLYANDRIGNFGARGELLANLVVPALPFNREGVPFASPDVKGSDKVAPVQDILTASSVSQRGVTFNFDQAYPVGQYANGDWWVQGPVSIPSMMPESGVVSGSYASATSTYANRVVHGAMLNPGNRSFAGGSASANSTNTNQGWDSLSASDGSRATLQDYDDSFNVDPGRTGEPLKVGTGSIVKTISRLTPRTDGRACLSDMVVLTVVSKVPAADALRPAISVGDKTSPFRKSEIDLSVFKKLKPPASAPTPAEAAGLVANTYENAFPDSINSRNIHPSNNMKEYGREIAIDVHTALMCLHCNMSEEEKMAIFLGQAQIAIDAWGRAVEGADVLPAGGGNGWKKSAMCMTAAAFHRAANTTALQSLEEYCDGSRHPVFAEDSQVIDVTPEYVLTARAGAPPGGHARGAFQWWMLGAAEFTPDGRNISYAGSEWDIQYRPTFCNSTFPGILAVQLTTGARAIWNREQTFRYFLGTQWHYDFVRRVVADSNGPSPLVLEFAMANRPAHEVVPRILQAGIRDDMVWICTDWPLDETSVPSIGDFTITVDGQPATVTALPKITIPAAPPNWPNPIDVTNGVWRTNVGLRLQNPVSGNSVVALSYQPGAQPIKTVDQVNMPAFTNRPVENMSDKVGGSNPSYPIVRFNDANPDRYQVVGQVALGPNAPRGTLWLPHIKLLSAPSGIMTLLGQAGGSPILEIEIHADRHLRLVMRNPSLARVARIRTKPLVVNTAYSILANWDMSDPSSSSGHTILLNGSNGGQSPVEWTAGTVGWSVRTPYTLGGTDAVNFNAEFGGLWLHTSERITDPSQIEMLSGVSKGKLAVSTSGDNITGTPPALFIVGNADQYNDPVGINRGAAPKFFRNQGGVTHVSGGAWQ